MADFIIEKITKDDNTPWVRVRKNGTSWVPALHELGRIMQLIGDCEDVKYSKGQGRLMPARFIYKATADGNCNIDELIRLYQTPSSQFRKQQMRFNLEELL